MAFKFFNIVWFVDSILLLKFLVKFDEDLLLEKSSKIRSKPVVLISDARAGTSTWSFSTEKPADDWFEEGFDHSKWDLGKGGFGREGTPGSKVNTKWHTPNIWLRKNFRLAAIPKTLRIPLHHDEDVQVYLNGKLQFSTTIDKEYLVEHTIPEWVRHLEEQG